jgi:hypothetical protein
VINKSDMVNLENNPTNSRKKRKWNTSSFFILSVL